MTKKLVVTFIIIIFATYICTVMNTKINLKQEQLFTLQRKRYRYNIMARFFFLILDLIAGKKHSLSKAKLLEILACIPYREWEIKKYVSLTWNFRNATKIDEADTIIKWSREAQDNEYMHLLVIHEKMKEEGIKDAWYLSPVVVFFAVWSYVLVSKIVKYVSLKAAFYFNAQFEDHAEHVYAEMVNDHPEWETQSLTNDLVKKYADVENWADVFRRISLDEREHGNNSFYFCGKPELIVENK